MFLLYLLMGQRMESAIQHHHCALNTLFFRNYLRKTTCFLEKMFKNEKLCERSLRTQPLHPEGEALTRLSLGLALPAGARALIGPEENRIQDSRLQRGQLVRGSIRSHFNFFAGALGRAVGQDVAFDISANGIPRHGCRGLHYLPGCQIGWSVNVC